MKWLLSCREEDGWFIWWNFLVVDAKPQKIGFLTQSAPSFSKFALIINNYGGWKPPRVLRKVAPWMKNVANYRSPPDPTTRSQIKLLKIEQCALPTKNPAMVCPSSQMIVENDMIWIEWWGWNLSTPWPRLDQEMRDLSPPC